MRSLRDMSILITGGGSGIGAGLAHHFAGRGAKVVISGRRGDKINAVASGIGPSCRAVAGDVTVPEDREALISAVIEHGGGLDALINNAANIVRGPITDITEQDLLDIFHSNVVAGMMLTGLAVPHLERRQGTVMFFGSVHTRRAFPGASPYAATKGALEALTKVLAAELGPKRIRVNCVVPGAVLTEINQRAGLFDDDTAAERLKSLAPAHVLGRIGTVEEIAEAVEYMIRAEWTTGAILDVDGGLGLGLTNA